MCTYCHKVVQRYTQSADLNVVRNLEQLQADLRTINSDPDMSPTNNGNMNLTVSKPYPFDFDDEENFYIQPLLRKASGTNASVTGMSSYYEKFDLKERPSAMPGRRPFDAFGVCAAEADMLKQVSGSLCLVMTNKIHDNGQGPSSPHLSSVEGMVVKWLAS